MVPLSTFEYGRCLFFFLIAGGVFFNLDNRAWPPSEVFNAIAVEVKQPHDSPTS